MARRGLTTTQWLLDSIAKAKKALQSERAREKERRQAKNDKALKEAAKERRKEAKWPST